jgi:hypothetical protein
MGLIHTSTTVEHKAYTFQKNLRFMLLGFDKQAADILVKP